MFRNDTPPRCHFDPRPESHQTIIVRWTSFLLRYFNQPKSKGISQIAFSLTGDFGFEKGGGVNGLKNDAAKDPAQNFASLMFYNRMWFAENKLAWTLGGGYINNPGRYLVYSTNIDWMPNQHITFRLEYVHRQSSVNYFAGHGGVTSPTGYATSPLTPDWQTDLVKFEDRVIVAILFRL